MLVVLAVLRVYSTPETAHTPFFKLFFSNHFF